MVVCADRAHGSALVVEDWHWRPFVNLSLAFMD